MKEFDLNRILENAKDKTLLTLKKQYVSGDINAFNLSLLKGDKLYVKDFIPFLKPLFSEAETKPITGKMEGTEILDFGIFYGDDYCVFYFVFDFA